MRKKGGKGERRGGEEVKERGERECGEERGRGEEERG